MGQLMVKDQYGCSRLAEQKRAWAVDPASSRGANYAHVMPPSDTSIGGININAAKDAQVAYYKCASLPASK